MFGKKGHQGRHKDKNKAKSGSHESLLLEDWQAEKTLSDCNRYMLSHELACDVYFKVGENKERIGAHKYVLMSRSSVFFLQCQSHGDSKEELEITDVEPEVFKLMLNYMYCDEVTLEDDTALPLLHCAKKYNLKTLLRKCLKFVEGSLKPTNACTILEQAHAFDENDLKDKALTYIYQNGEQVLKTEGFEKLSKSCLASVLESDCLKAKELDIFDAAMAWATKQCEREGRSANGENKRDVLGDVLYLIRYLLLNQKEFVEHVSTQNVLTAEEKCEILECLAVSGKHSDTFSSKARNKPAPTTTL